MEKDKKLKLRKLKVTESGIPGYLLVRGHDPGHVKRELRRYFMEKYGLNKEEATSLAEEYGVERTGVGKEDPEAYAKRVLEEYDVRVDLEKKRYSVRARNKEEAKAKWRRFLEEEMAMTPEEAKRAAEDIGDKK